MIAQNPSTLDMERQPQRPQEQELEQVLKGINNYIQEETQEHIAELKQTISELNVLRIADENTADQVADNIGLILHGFAHSMEEEMRAASNLRICQNNPILQSILSIHIHDLKNKFSRILNLPMAELYNFEEGAIVEIDRNNLIMQIDRLASDLSLNLSSLEGIPTDLSSFIQRFSQSTADDQISFEREEDVRIICHERVMEELLKELIGNARAAIDEGGRIGVLTRRADQNAIIEINDNGQGIPPNDLARIFRPGYTTKGDQGGTGMGLYFAKQYIEGMGGSIEIESRHGGENSGTKVAIQFPLAEQEQAKRE